MPVNVADLKPVGEFGSKAWCEACAKYGMELLEDGDLPADTAWGFSGDLHPCPGASSRTRPHRVRLLPAGAVLPRAR